MSTPQKIIQLFKNRPGLADLLSVGGIIAYALELWIFAHQQLSILDEGLYLYKGWMFATGRYVPFQDYGPWTNQMPMAFLIPGWVETIFGPGIRTGRIMAVVLALLMIFGLWLTARRQGGRWIALASVVALAVNPAAARMLTMAASQGLVACLLVWTLFFTLGNGRRIWQVFSGGLLAGIVVMVRIDMLPLLPLLLGYMLWARGIKHAAWLSAGMLLTFGGVHLVYWPNILRLWAKWLPFPFLSRWFPPKAVPTWNPDNPIEFRIASFFLAFRYHFAALAGAVAAWVLWPRNPDQSIGAGVQVNEAYAERRKIAFFLSVLLLVSFFLHAWAALGNEYCVFCFPTYTTFYANLGILLVAITLPGWNLHPAAWRKWLGAGLFLLMFTGMAYSAEGAAEQMLGASFYKQLLALHIPGTRGAQLWQILANKFRLEYGIIYDDFHVLTPMFLAGVFVVLVFVVIKLAQIKQKSSLSWISGILAILVTGTLLAPIPVLAGDYTTYDCQADMISVNESMGKTLSATIPAGSRIFWMGYSPVSLLYLPGAQIYPPQLNGVYSFRVSQDDDAMLKYGWWNDSLAQKWLTQADYVIVEQKNLGKNDWLTTRLGNFSVVAQVPSQTCRQDSALFVYRRK